MIERLKIQKTFMVARGTMMMRKQGQGMSKDMLRVHLVREQMDKQIEDWLIIPEVKVTGSESDRK